MYIQVTFLKFFTYGLIVCPYPVICLEALRKPIGFGQVHYNCNILYC